MRKLLILVVLFCIANLKAQDYVKMYSDFIPVDTIKSNSTLSNTFNKNIEVLGKINPDLIYYYVKYMDLMLSKNIVNPDSNYKSGLNSYRNNFRMDNNDFINKQIGILEQKNYSFRKKQKLKESFKSKISPHVKQALILPQTNIDINLQGYFAYLYLSNQSDSQYDESINYNNKCLEVSDRLKNKYFSFIENWKLKNLNPDFLILEEVLGQSYLFNGKYENKYYKKDGREFIDFMGQFMQQYFKVWEQLEFYYSYGILPKLYNAEYRIKDPALGDMKVKTDLSLFSFLNIGVGYQQSNKLEYGSFSFYRYALRFSYQPGKVVSDKVNRKIVALQGVGLFGGPFEFTREIDNYFSASAEINTPLFYFSRNFYLEGGLEYTFQSLSAIIKITRDNYRLTYPNRYPQYVIPNPEINKLKKINHQIAPKISLVYSINHLLELRSELPMVSLSTDSDFQSWINWRFTLVYKMRQ